MPKKFRTHINMDEIGATVNKQSSIGSDSTGDDQNKLEHTSLPLDKRICLVGNVVKNTSICTTAQSFGVPVLTSENGLEYSKDQTCSTVFVVESFEGNDYEQLFKSRHPLLGPPALQQLLNRNEKLPNNTRPLYNLAMSGVVVCFTGFRNKDELTKLVPLVHHMGGSIRKEMSAKVTHLIANVAGGDKYQYAATFRVPIMHLNWVFSSWENRNDVNFTSTIDTFMAEHKLKPFYGAKVCFAGFPEEEEKHMTEVLEANGGCITVIDDPQCTHVVVDESTVGEKLEGPPKAHIVKAEWFWTSVQKGISLEEKDYLFGDYINQVLSPNTRRDSHQATPSSASRRKRKRLYETLSSLAQQQSPGLHNKRRSSIVSDAGLLSVSGSFLDCTASPDKPGDVGGEPAIPDTPRKGFTARQQVFLELVQTESNYVNILNIIMTMFKEQLENSTDEEALLNNTELKIIFGNLPPIYETHLKMLEELRRMSAYWTEDKSIGSIILKYSTDLLKAYPPFVNFFEEMKSMLVHCDQTKPRFHAFLKACQTKPECGRQSLQELLIRPVQRLPSISLLLNDILKNTPKNNADHAALEKALASIREVMKHINEDKRKTEGQRVMFDIFNEIDNCPPDLVSSHRNFVAKSEVIQLSSSEGLSSKGNPLVLFLFSDQLEVCKKRSKAFNTLKSPNTVNGVHKNSSIKPYKHVKLMSLSTIKRVIDIKETEDCQRVFSLVFRNTEELKERVCSFAMTDEESDKVAFLKTLCKQMATNACTADSEKFMAYLEPHQLDIDTSDINHGTLSRAFKFATKTRLRVGRAFSFNKTPSKLKRAVSSMMSPFGSSTNLTPASQLAQMRLASYNNISELGNAENASESPPQAPMSVQPTRKMKASSLGVNALKRL
ncbi:protein ECT2 isoform X3 [Onthophagus taurus]|uniref:protein ECT2 isoform X3 n=1 Tax=Onthophagus taurus TaxID=166361 RepID=UPI0039BEA52F